MIPAEGMGLIPVQLIWSPKQVFMTRPRQMALNLGSRTGPG